MKYDQDSASLRLRIRFKRKIMEQDNEMLQQLGQQAVLDESGNPLQLSSLWQEHRTAMVFVRHFG